MKVNKSLKILKGKSEAVNRPSMSRSDHGKPQKSIYISNMYHHPTSWHQTTKLTHNVLAIVLYIRLTYKLSTADYPLFFYRIWSCWVAFLFCNHIRFLSWRIFNVIQRVYTSQMLQLLIEGCIKQLQFSDWIMLKTGAKILLECF
jgi:hypothetical protein